MRITQLKSKICLLWAGSDYIGHPSEVLTKIKQKGYKIGMLSNGDKEMMLPLQEMCKVEFDYIFSAQDAQCYKPCPEVYEKVIESLGIKKEELLHVAGSMFDVTGTVSAGIPCAWSNRNSEDVLNPKYKPTYNMKNLADLLVIL